MTVLGYPFYYKRVKNHVENLALYVDKEEKVWMELIISAHVLERMSQAACLCAAEKSMKVHFLCIILYFGRLSKETACPCGAPPNMKMSSAAQSAPSSMPVNKSVYSKQNRARSHRSKLL
jgi:hypothetical protein